MPDSVEATVETAQATSSADYTNLTTVGPSVTLTLTEGQRVLVLVSATIGGAGLMTVEVTGASTLAPSDRNAAYAELDPGQVVRSTRQAVYVPGSTGVSTFVARYRSLSGTSTFGFRRVTVIPL